MQVPPWLTAAGKDSPYENGRCRIRKQLPGNDVKVKIFVKNTDLANEGNYGIENCYAKYDAGDKCLVNMLFHIEEWILKITNATWLLLLKCVYLNSHLQNPCQ